MRLNHLILAIVLVQLLIAPAVGASQVPGDVRISLLNQVPDPAEPGQYVDLRFKIENFGTQPVADLRVKLEEKYPIILAGESPERFLGNLWGGLYGEYGVVVKYRVRLADDAPDGTSRITLLYHSGNDNWTSQDYNLNVRAIYDQIFIRKIASKPEVIPPGGNANVTFELVNMGKTTMKDITLSLDFTGGSIPFVPNGELSQKRLRFLKPNEDSVITFSLKADPNAASKMYKVPVSLGYYDSVNNHYTRSDVIGLQVGGKPNIFVGLDETKVYTPGSNGELVIDVVNNGETDVKFLKVKFLENNDYVIIEGKEQYIGNLESDDFETVKLKIHLKGSAAHVKLPVQLEYNDGLGNSYKEVRNVDLPVYSKAQVYQYGLKERSHTVLTVLVVLGILLLIFLLRRLRKSRA